MKSLDRMPSPLKCRKLCEKEKEAHNSPEESMESLRKSHWTGLSQYHTSVKLSFHKEHEVEVFRPANDRARISMDFHRYCSEDRSTRYNKQAAKNFAKWVSTLQVQMKSRLFDPMDPLSRIRFLHAYKMSCDNSGLQEANAVWLVPFLMKEKAVLAPTACLSLKCRSLYGSVKAWMPTSHGRVVNHHLKTYAIVDMITKAGMEIVRFTQPKYMSPFQ